MIKKLKAKLSLGEEVVDIKTGDLDELIRDLDLYIEGEQPN